MASEISQPDGARPKPARLRAGQVAVQARQDTLQLLHLSIRAGVLQLLGGLGDLIFDGRAPLRRVVGHRDIVVRRIIDGREWFILVGGTLDGLSARSLEAGADRGIET